MLAPCFRGEGLGCKADACRSRCLHARCLPLAPCFPLAPHSNVGKKRRQAGHWATRSGRAAEREGERAGPDAHGRRRNLSLHILCLLQPSPAHPDGQRVASSIGRCSIRRCSIGRCLPRPPRLPRLPRLSCLCSCLATAGGKRKQVGRRQRGLGRKQVQAIGHVCDSGQLGLQPAQLCQHLPPPPSKPPACMLQALSPTLSPTDPVPRGLLTLCRGASSGRSARALRLDGWASVRCASHRSPASTCVPDVAEVGAAGAGGVWLPWPHRLQLPRSVSIQLPRSVSIPLLPLLPHRCASERKRGQGVCREHLALPRPARAETARPAHSRRPLLHQNTPTLSAYHTQALSAYHT
jgi:hypothetical protein